MKSSQPQFLLSPRALTCVTQLELLLFAAGVPLASPVSHYGMAGWVRDKNWYRPTYLFACMAAVQTGVGQKPNEGRWLGQLTGTVRESTEESPPSSLYEWLFAGLLVWVSK